MSEKRAGQRRRTRLRTGKIADLAGRFIVECAVHDRSAEGARLRLVRRVAVPGEMLLYEDEPNTLTAATIVWRAGQDLGVRFGPEVNSALMRDTLKALGSRYYAL